MSTPKMMPGQDPYTKEELEIVERFIKGACLAVEVFSEEELEDYQRQQQMKEKRK